jgi:hypothetical protein
MKRSLVSSSLLLVTFVLPAESKCYSKWYYPYPQHCNAGVAKLVNAEDLKSSGKSLQVQALPPAPDDDNDHSWYVEIISLPPNWEREIALDKLKEQMK